MAAQFHTTRRMEFCDTDMAGLVHFANFFRFMESAEVEFLRSLGMCVTDKPPAQKFGFPRVSASCDYLQPARFEDLIDISVTVSNIGRKSITYAFEFARKGEPVARGQISAVCCRTMDDGRLESIEIPAHVRRALERQSQAEKPEIGGPRSEI
jgi:YbgC/YbaW family acyl-CoA thioester hydrolase